MEISRDKLLHRGMDNNDFAMPFAQQSVLRRFIGESWFSIER
jgi:hypothetical protein